MPAGVYIFGGKDFDVSPADSEGIDGRGRLQVAEYRSFFSPPPRSSPVKGEDFVKLPDGN
jgi:hypothetical protein